MNAPYYKVSYEYMPDCSADPDAFREHRVVEFKLPPTKAVRAEIGRAFTAFDKLDATAGKSAE